MTFYRQVPEIDFNGNFNSYVTLVVTQNFILVNSKDERKIHINFYDITGTARVPGTIPIKYFDSILQGVPLQTVIFENVSVIK